LIEVDRIFFERVFLLGIITCGGIFRACDGLSNAGIAIFGYAVADIVDGVITRHIPLLQEVNGVALAFSE